MCYFFILFNGGYNCKFIPTSFSIISFFFLNQTNKFFIFLLFHPPNQIQEKTKFILSSHFSIPFSFFILSFFHYYNQMEPKGLKKIVVEFLGVFVILTMC